MTIEQLKKELNLTNKDLAGFLDLKPINYANSTAKKRYEKAFCAFYKFLKSDSDQLPSFLYKSDGGLYFKHRENTDVTEQWNEYLKNR